MVTGQDLVCPEEQLAECKEAPSMKTLFLEDACKYVFTPAFITMSQLLYSTISDSLIHVLTLPFIAFAISNYNTFDTPSLWKKTPTRSYKNKNKTQNKQKQNNINSEKNQFFEKIRKNLNPRMGLF